MRKTEAQRNAQESSAIFEMVTLKRTYIYEGGDSLGTPATGWRCQSCLPPAGIPDPNTPAVQSLSQQGHDSTETSSSQLNAHSATQAQEPHNYTLRTPKLDTLGLPVAWPPWTYTWTESWQPHHQGGPAIEQKWKAYLHSLP